MTLGVGPDEPNRLWPVFRRGPGRRAQRCRACWKGSMPWVTP